MEVITNGWAFMLYCGWVVFHVCGGEPSSLNHSSNDRHAVSNAWLLWIVLQYPCQGRCLLDSMPSFPLGVRPGRPLDRTTFLVLIFFFFWGSSAPFPTAALPIYIPANRVQGLLLLCILVRIGYVLLTVCHMEARGYLMLILICMSLMTHSIEFFHEIVGYWFEKYL